MATVNNTDHSLSYTHPRSCTVCRQRKVKCDRQRPCTNCIRNGADCLYPPGPGRAPKRPRRVADTRVLDRLSRMEKIVKQFQSQAEGSNNMNTVDESKDEKSSDTDKVEQKFGLLLIDEGRSCYVSNVLWASFGDAIGELRDLLQAEETEDASFEAVSENPSLGSNAAIMGFCSLAHSLHQYHPPLSQSAALLQIFQENVAPLVRIFHMPTLFRVFWDAIASLDSVDKNTEALLFSIYYSAVISLDSEQCISILGVPRANAQETYRFAVEQAMARANLLDTKSVILLQAAVLFLTALRNEDDSRTVWSMTALIFHIAQAMGLHRDGTAFGLRPLETELRRRLWWHICLLDTRSSEYHGCERIVNDTVFDTKLPLNINDSDITPVMAEAPVEHEGATEMTFCLIRCEVLRVVWKISHAKPKNRPSMADREKLNQELRNRLEDKYLKHCNPSVPILLVASTVARVVIARTLLMVHYSPSQNGVPNVPPDIRDRIFAASIELLEHFIVILTNQDIAKFAWHSRTHIQWHLLALPLSEICSRPPSSECDHAWECVNTVYNKWENKEYEKKETLRYPVKRLMAKAQYVRDMQGKSRDPLMQLFPENNQMDKGEAEIFDLLCSIPDDASGFDWNAGMDGLFFP
ncbi:hypothetical protein ASPWEDRAFT_62525 [Aspergillus wentii DTO 134E9]|uniref:Zn(2)-C6 fungal-type domain-containing protein n=1 Tax=Aspergillus wentii DTO 134E9 TaxID=1073089 RepID=A0A1L9R8U0_ASPWE|nr:uncharacterized protein ASPWEDRAFT_62525 [Aspergillus wentii DTO 134E9]OJJ31303.1 hypothetical protein ASPWEDRAFT_62525 [Aspergillus wentii DTO 134E9]